MWVKIEAAVDNLGPAKTIKQCKDKMRNLKDTYKRAKESNKKTGAVPSFPPYFTQIDEILGCRDVMSLPEKTFPTTKLTPTVTQIQIIINPLFKSKFRKRS